MDNIFERVIVEPFQRFFDILIQFLPNLFSAILIIAVGLAVAWAARHVFVRICRFLRVDEFAERAGVDKIFSKGGIHGKASDVIGRVVGWVVIFAFMMIALSSLNVLAIDRLFERFFLYLPNVFVAAFILVFGFMLGNFFGRAALITAVNAGLLTAGLIGKLVRFSIYVFSVSIALEQLGIGKETVVIAFALIVGGIVLALSLAFGLGGRDLAREYLEKRIRGSGEKGDDISHL